MTAPYPDSMSAAAVLAGAVEDATNMCASRSSWQHKQTCLSRYDAAAGLRTSCSECAAAAAALQVWVSPLSMTSSPLRVIARWACSRCQLPLVLTQVSAGTSGGLHTEAKPEMPGLAWGAEHQLGRPGLVCSNRCQEMWLDLLCAVQQSGEGSSPQICTRRAQCLTSAAAAFAV